MPVEYAGYIPTLNHAASPPVIGVFHNKDHAHPRGRRGGAYVHYALQPGPTHCRLSYGTYDTPTPGTPYYFNRRILGEHALRYMDENPIAAMRLSDPNAQTRIHTVGYELTDEERTKAGNNDYQIRGTIGFMWGLNEALRLRPYGTQADDLVWHAMRAELR